MKLALVVIEGTRSAFHKKTIKIFGNIVLGKTAMFVFMK